FFIAFLIATVSAITLYVQLNTIVQVAIESFGPKMTQTTVKLSSVSLSPFSGKGRIRGFIIGSPKCFDAPSALKLKDIRVSLEPKSLASDKIMIHEISIDSPEITYEMKRSGNNLQTIEKNIESFVPTSQNKEKTASGKEEKVEIDSFTLKNGKV